MSEIEKSILLEKVYTVEELQAEIKRMIEESSSKTPRPEIFSIVSKIKGYMISIELLEDKHWDD